MASDRDRTQEGAENLLSDPAPEREGQTDKLARWYEEHHRLLNAFPGEYVAIDPAKGIVAHDRDPRAMHDALRAANMLESVVIDWVPSER